MTLADSLLVRMKNAWSVFRYGEEALYRNDIGSGQGNRPDRQRFLYGNERSIIAGIYTRIAIDVAAIGIRHVRVDENGNYKETLDTALNECFTLGANIDQTGRSFVQDIVMSLCDEGSIAVVPTDTTTYPRSVGAFDVLTMRTGRIVQWYPEHVRVNLYNQKTGLRQDIVLPKTLIAIIENPLYAIMNEPNSTLKRLIDKLNILDVIDKQSGSGKLDIIVQLPFAIKTEARRLQAEVRRGSIETQLKDSQYGIAYIDATEKVTQLNRPAENNLMGQIEYLTSTLYSQLGLTKEVFEGTADEPTMVNYYNRTIEPILSAITDAMKRVFITKTGRSQGQTLMGIRDPFRLVPASALADLADKFTRNEIVTSNEFRAIIGMKPSTDPKADELRNKNLNQKSEGGNPDDNVDDNVLAPAGFSKNGKKELIKQ